MDSLQLLEVAMLLLASVVAVTRLLRGRVWQSRECYMLDYACYRPPEDRQVNTEASVYLMGVLQPKVNFEKLRLQWRIHLRSGLGEQTYASHFLFSERSHATVDDGRLEMEEAFVALLDQLFAKTGVAPRDVDFLIVNVSTFSPEPSHASVIVNLYGMRQDVKTYDLSGMGCAANVVALGLAKDLLRLYPGSLALLVGTECTTLNSNYAGEDNSMMLTDCLFRVGGSAVMLSSRRSDAARASMRLQHVVRTTHAADGEAYGCVRTTEDADGNYGIALSLSLLAVAAEAVRRNLTALAPRVLPVSELLRYGAAVVLRAVTRRISASASAAAAPLVPNFGATFEHFCIHPGGRAVINGIGKRLQLTEEDMEASRMALHRFGNTSTSGIWYEVAYMDAKRRLRRGDRIWQIALGSGFKCNSAVWQVLRPLDTMAAASTVWDEDVHRYPCGTKRPTLFDDAYVEPFLQSVCRQRLCLCTSH